MVQKLEEKGSIEWKPGRWGKSIIRLMLGYCKMVRHACEYGAKNYTQYPGLLSIKNYPCSEVASCWRKEAEGEAFSLEFLACMNGQRTFCGQMKPISTFTDLLTIKISQIWAKEKPFATSSVPMHSPKVTVWCGVTDSWMLGIYFYEDIGPVGPVICTVNGNRYASFFEDRLYQRFHNVHACLKQFSCKMALFYRKASHAIAQEVCQK